MDRAGAADLVERVEAAIGATRTEAVCQRLSRAAEQRAGQDICGTTEVRVIEKIEKLSPETKRQSLRQMKLPLQCEIYLPRSKTSQHVAAEVALRSSGRRGKSSAIEDLASRKLRVMNLEWDTRNHVRSRSELRAGTKKATADNVNRWS